MLDIWLAGGENRAREKQRNTIHYYTKGNMESEKIKQNEIRFFEYINARDFDSMDKWIDEYVDDRFVNHSPVLDAPPDKEGLKEMMRRLSKSFPDYSIQTKEMVFENGWLCFRHIVTGIGDNDLMGIAMVKFENQKATERWVVAETIK